LSNLLRDALCHGERLIGEEIVTLPASVHPLLEEERRAGYDEGFAAGRQAGRADGLAGLDHTLSALQTAARAAMECRDAAVRAAEVDVVDLALAIAEKIVRSRAESDPELAVTLVREALKRISDRSRLQIRVHPDCLAPVAARRAEWLEAMGSPGPLEIVPDRRVPPGGAEVVFPEGIVDARLETQLAEARRLFDERRHEALAADGEAA